QRIKLQYVSANPESAFYQAAARKMAKALSIYSDPPTAAALRIGAGFNTLPAGGGWVGWAALAGHPQAFDPLHHEYQIYRSQEEFNLSRHIGTPFDLRQRTAASNQPPFAAATVGQFLSGGGGTVGHLGGLATLPAAEALFRQATLEAF